MSWRRWRRRIRWPFSYAAVAVTAWVACHLPLSLLRFICGLIGRAIWCLPDNRKLILTNLKLAFPDWTDARRCDIGKRSCIHLTYSFLELFWYHKRLPALLKTARFNDEGEAFHQQMQQQHAPAMLLTPHLGCWEIAIHVLGQNGIQASAVARKLTNPWIETFFRQRRELSGCTIIHEKGAIRGLLKSIRQKEAICLLVDQNTRPRHGGYFVPFFGLPASMSRAPAMLHRKSRLPVYGVACIRQPDFSYIFHMEPIVGPDEDIDDVAFGERINAFTERYIASHPEQYLWLYERWRYFEMDGDAVIPAQDAYPYYAEAPRYYPPKGESDTDGENSE